MPLTLHLTAAPLVTFAADPEQLPAWRLLHREADRLAPELTTVWQTLFQDVRTNLDEAALRAALERGNLLDVEALLTQLWEQQAAIPGREVLIPLLRETVQRAAAAVTPHLASAVQVALGTMPVAVTIPASLPWIETYTGTQIQGIGEHTLQAVRGIIREGFTEGTSAQRLAEQIRAEIGLTRRQVRSVEAFRQRLLDEGRTARQVAREVEFATQVGVRQRALNISRTESMAAANAGQQELWRQAQAQGLLEPDYWQRQWLTAQDEHVCPTCGPMGGQRREMEQPFTTPDGGTVLFPPAHPSCRCTVVLVARGAEA